MSNKAKMLLFLVFAGLTFYQFYTFARTFNPSALYPQDTSNPTVLNGVYSLADVKTSRSSVNFDPSILLLALNIVLWVERPNRIGRTPLILAFIANLAIVIIRVGIAVPALRIAAAAPQSDIQNVQNLASLYAKWNAVNLIPATISGMIVLGIFIRYYADDPEFMSSLRLHSQKASQLWESTTLAAKVTYLPLLIFVALTFYQFYMYATLVRFSPTTLPNLSKLNIPIGRADVVVTSGGPSFSFNPLFLLLLFNILLWLRPPQRIGHRPLMAALIANLAIVVIRIGIATPVIQLASAPEHYNLGTANWQIQQLRAQWDTVYLVASCVSGLIVVGILAYSYATSEASPVSITVRSMKSWQFWKTPPMPATIEFALLLVFVVLILYQFFALASGYPFDQLLGQHVPVVIGVFSAPSSTTRFDPSTLLIVLNIILLIRPLNPSWRAPLAVILIANLAVIGIQQGIIIPALQQEYVTGNGTLETFNSNLRWRFVRVVAAAISAVMMGRLLVQLVRKR